MAADLRAVYVAGDGDVKGPATSSDSELPLFNGSTGKLIKGSGTVVTAQGRALLDDNTPAEQRTTLQLGSAALQNSTAAGNALLTAVDVPTQRTALGLGTSALVNYTGVGGGLMVAADAAAARGVIGLGTASTRNIMATVATWGTNDVLVSGAYGLGTTGAVSMPSGTIDCNSHTVGGNWRINSPSNAPSGVAYGLLSVVPGTDICAQQIQRHDASRMWFRGGINGSWQSWREPVTGRPTAWLPLYGFAGNWSSGFNLGSQRQGNMCSLHCNIQCNSGLGNYQAICWVQHAPATSINFVGELLGNNGASQCISFALRNDGLLMYNYSVGAASSPGIPSYPMAMNITVNFRTADGGTNND